MPGVNELFFSHNDLFIPEKSKKINEQPSRSSCTKEFLIISAQVDNLWLDVQTHFFPASTHRPPVLSKRNMIYLFSATNIYPAERGYVRALRGQSELREVGSRVREPFIHADDTREFTICVQCTRDYWRMRDVGIL